MPGPTANRPETMTSQFYDAEAVSLASTDWLAGTAVTSQAVARGVYIGGAGNLKVDLAGVPGQTGQTGVTFTGVLVGTTLQIDITKIYKVGTTATNLVALY